MFVTVYLTVAVPAAIPVTTPFWLMLAWPERLFIDQSPPATVLVNGGVDWPVQTNVAPPPSAGTTGLLLIVTLAVVVLEQPPPLKVYVTVYVFGVLDERLMVPVELFRLNPAGAAEYTPPAWPVLTTISDPELQYGPAP